MIDLAIPRSDPELHARNLRRFLPAIAAITKCGKVAVVGQFQLCHLQLRVGAVQMQYWFAAEESTGCMILVIRQRGEVAGLRRGVDHLVRHVWRRLSRLNVLRGLDVRLAL